MDGRRLGLGIWDGGAKCGPSFSSYFVCFFFFANMNLEGHSSSVIIEQLNPLLLFSIAFLTLEFADDGTI